MALLTDVQTQPATQPAAQTPRKLTGGQIVAEYLTRAGVPYLVGIPGHGIMAFLDAFHDYTDKIKILMPRHEQSAVHFADGYYRVTGKPLAVYTSIGPGALNTASR